jgi:hypothetical protein
MSSDEFKKGQKITPLREGEGYMKFVLNFIIYCFKYVA